MNVGLGNMDGIVTYNVIVWWLSMVVVVVAVGWYMLYRGTEGVVYGHG